MEVKRFQREWTKILDRTLPVCKVASENKLPTKVPAMSNCRAVSELTDPFNRWTSPKNTDGPRIATFLEKDCSSRCIMIPRKHISSTIGAAIAPIKIEFTKSSVKVTFPPSKYKTSKTVSGRKIATTNQNWLGLTSVIRNCIRLIPNRRDSHLANK